MESVPAQPVQRLLAPGVPHGTDDEVTGSMDRIELPPPGRRRSSLQRMGLSHRQRDRVIDWTLVALAVVFGTAWMAAIVHAVASDTPRPGLSRGIAANPLSPAAPAPAVYLLDAALTRFARDPEVRGYSGQVNIVVHEPGSPTPLPADIEEDTEIELVSEEGDTMVATPSTPPRPGVWNVLVRVRNEIRQVPDLTVLSVVPLTEKRSGRIGSYVIGTWPHEDGSTPRTPAYAAPRGMVRVTPDNLDLPVSRHFRLRHFVTKGQENVWPKYVLISPRLLDKLELTIDELERMGHPVRRVGVISGFRTPSYNAGGGDTAGRGALSRHMYGDAMDWFIDNDGDGRMDDLTGDGRAGVADLRVMVEAAERVERRYPDLAGGIGVYPPTGAHAGFIHIDTRGYRARW
ncbi:MAG TPA: hypothetical protein VK929_17255 [Longimicrobiales bacterium]|nr:hypothetical protein [Longimicrobiales bacterium]